MKIVHAFAGLAAAGALSFAVVVPAAATAHKSTVHVSAGVLSRTVLAGKPLMVRGVVSPHAVGPVVLERLTGQSWSVVARARTSRGGAYSVTVGTAHRTGTWLLRVLRPGTATTKPGVTSTLRVQVVSTAYTVTATARASVLYAGNPIDVDGTVSPVPSAGVRLEWLDGTTWRLVDTVVVGSNGVFAGELTRPPGTWQLRVVQPGSASVASGASEPITVRVVPQPAP